MSDLKIRWEISYYYTNNHSELTLIVTPTYSDAVIFKFLCCLSYREAKTVKSCSVPCTVNRSDQK
jgi:hypothetical protein